MAPQNFEGVAASTGKDRQAEKPATVLVCVLITSFLDASLHLSVCTGDSAWVTQKSNLIFLVVLHFPFAVFASCLHRAPSLTDCEVNFVRTHDTIARDC